MKPLVISTPSYVTYLMKPLSSEKRYFDTKLVRKTLRSLPEWFAYKVTAIEEARDVNIMKLDELMRSL